MTPLGRKSAAGTQVARVPYRQELTPVSFLERAGTVHADRPAIVDGKTSYTWHQFRARSRCFASALRAAGLRHGDRVAFIAFNSEPMLLANFAVLQAGGVLVPVNTRLNAEEVGYILEHSGSRYIFVSPELQGLVPQPPIGTQLTRIGSEFETFLSSGSPEPLDSWLIDESELCSINYTSGTTGRPKGVMYHHRGAYLNALGMVVENRLNSGSTVLWTLPMFHCNGWSQTWSMAAAGCRSLAIPRVDPGAVWDLLERESVTHFNAAPTVLIMLANDPGARRLNRPVRVCTGGAPPSPTLIAQMAELNVDLVHLYGLTETYGPLTINVPPPEIGDGDASEQALYAARQGYPHVSAGRVRVVDSDLFDVPADGASMGEVVAEGNTLMMGYFEQPEETAEAFRGGWLHTGDIGVMHPDGSLELRDRKKDVIISGGENISTIEVEQAVMSHPAVMEAAVIAVPDEKWGEVPKAFVALKPRARASAEEIIAHVRDRIAHFKAPRHVEFGDLPKTSTGKIQKFVLRDKEWKGRRRRIN